MKSVRLGDVLFEDDIAYVITAMENNIISKKVRLDDVIKNTIIVKFDGEYISIQELIEYQCEKYLMSKRVHEVEEI